MRRFRYFVKAGCLGRAALPYPDKIVGKHGLYLIDSKANDENRWHEASDGLCWVEYAKPLGRKTVALYDLEWWGNYDY